MPKAAQYHAHVPKNKPLKQVLAENVRAVMSARRLSQPKVAALARQKGFPIDPTTVGRIARAEIPTTVEKIQAIAAGVGLEPWQMLVPGLDPAKAPALGESQLTADETELLDKYRAASGRWKISMRYMARLQADAQQEEAASYLLSKIFATPVPDERVEETYGFPPGHKPKERIKEAHRSNEPRSGGFRTKKLRR